MKIWLKYFTRENTKNVGLFGAFRIIYIADILCVLVLRSKVERLL